MIYLKQNYLFQLKFNILNEIHIHFYKISKKKYFLKKIDFIIKILKISTRLFTNQNNL